MHEDPELEELRSDRDYLQSELCGFKEEVQAQADEIRELKERITELEVELNQSDELRGVVVDQAAGSARVTTETLKRLEIYQPIVEAAVLWDKSLDQVSGSLGTTRRLRELVKVEVKRRESQS